MGVPCPANVALSSFTPISSHIIKESLPMGVVVLRKWCKVDFYTHWQPHTSFTEGLPMGVAVLQMPN